MRCKFVCSSISYCFRVLGIRCVLPSDDCFEVWGDILCEREILEFVIVPEVRPEINESAVAVSET